MNYRFWLIKLYLYFKGIRFYRTDREPTSASIQSVEFMTLNDLKVKFSLYREVYDDLYFSRNRIFSKKFTGLMIYMSVDKEVPKAITKFNNLKVVFPSDIIINKFEKEVFRYLLNIFALYVKKEMST